MYRKRMRKDEILAGVEEPISSSKVVARNTVRYVLENGEVRYRLYQTDIIRFTDSVVTLDTGGFNTVTTRDRMSSFGPPGVRVSTERGTICVSARSLDENGDLVIRHKPFTRTADVYPGGRIVTDQDEGAESYDDLRPYVDNYINKLKRNGVPLDGSGDPWVPVNKDGKYPAEDVKLWIGVPSVVEAMGDDLSGVPYVFPSFIKAAFEFTGMPELGQAMHVQGFNAGRESDRRRVCGIVRRYIRACLGFAT